MAVKKSGRSRTARLKVPLEPFWKSMESDTRWQELYREHPIKAQLEAALRLRRDALYLRGVRWAYRRSKSREKGPTSLKMNSKMNSEIMQIESEMDEIRTWIVGPLRPLSENEIRQHQSDLAGILADIRELSGNRIPFDEITRDLQEAEKSLRRKPRGRPVSQRPDAVTALETQLANPGLSWMNLAKKICPCGAARHGEDCKQRIRQEVMALKRVLSKYQIPH